MKKTKLSLIIILIISIVSLLVVSAYATSSTSLMRYSFKTEQARKLDWDIARTLHYGEPEHNYYYYVYEGGTIEQGTYYDGIYEGGLNQIWIDNNMEQGELNIDVSNGPNTSPYNSMLN
ncbi:MAG: hypothetical protein PWR10_839 [Halanaerobiales bacterium]|nr:hypothetical protein [Halanaerobiales bacterium]